MVILSWIVIGFVVGALARLIVPTGRRYGCIGTVVLGIAGSAVGGLLASLLAGDGFDLRSSGFVGSVVGAVIVLVFVRWRDSGKR